MKRWIRALSVATAVGFAVSATAADTIVIGHIADLTGPTSAVGKPDADGVQADADGRYPVPMPGLLGKREY